jgi:hypothetical protein
MRRAALIEIDVTVINNVTKIVFAWNRHMDHQHRIADWINTAEDILTHLVQTLEKKEPEYTLSDFPLLGMDYAGLQSLKNNRLPTMGLSSFDEIENIYPCSPMQQGILLSQIKLAGSYEVEQISRVMSQKGHTVDVKRFKIAWQQVVDRHALLRTVFFKSVSTSGSIFWQAVLRCHEASIVHLTAGSEEEAIRLLENRTSPQFYETQPSHRLTVCEVSPQVLFYKIEISHALIDGMSKTIVMQDLTQAYEQTLPCDSGPLYSNYITYLQKQPLAPALEYWTTHLKNTRPCLLPTLSKTRDVSADYGSISVTLDVAALNKFCASNAVTVASLVKAAWGIVLRAFTNSDEVCFGYLTSGRDVPVDGVGDCVGVFINMLICCLNISYESEINLLIRGIQEDFLKSLPFQHCSLAEIRHGLDLGNEPLFNTVLSIQRHGKQVDEVDSMIAFQSIIDRDPTEVCHSI